MEDYLNSMIVGSVFWEPIKILGMGAAIYYMMSILANLIREP